MTDVDFPDLASPAAESTHPPAYEGLIRRARARRRRHAIGSATAAAVAVIVVAVAVTSVADRPTTSGPVDTPTPSAPSSPSIPGGGLTAEQVVAQGQLSGIAGTDDGSITLWRACRSGDRGCEYAWRLQQGPPPTGLLPGPGTWNVDAAGDHFVITDGEASSGGVVVGLDGSTTSIEDGGPLPLTDDVVLVRSTSRHVPGYALVDAARGTRWPLDRPDGVDGWASAAVADGQVWAMATTRPGDTRIDLWHSTDGTTWQRRSLTVGDPTMPGSVVASGAHVAALATYDGATVAPVGDLAITSDGGATWHDLPSSAVPFAFVDSMAATAGGTLFVAGGQLEGGGPMRLYRSTDDSWTHFAEVDLPDGEQVTGLKSAGATVIGRTGSYDEPDLVSLEDGGAVQPWTNPIR